MVIVLLVDETSKLYGKVCWRFWLITMMVWCPAWCLIWNHLRWIYICYFSWFTFSWGQNTTKKMNIINKKTPVKVSTWQVVLAINHTQNLNRTSVRYHQCKLAHWFRNDNNPGHERLEIWILNSEALGVQKHLILPEILMIIQYMQTW